MVPSRCVKSEYMKRYKEPQWEACGPCYQERLRYRLSRRLLEQAHRPWFWDDWEQSSGSGGSPSPPGTSSPPAAQQREEEAAGPAEVPRRASPAEPQRGAEEEEHEKAEVKVGIKETEKKSTRKERSNSTSRQSGNSPSHSALTSQGVRRQAKSPQRTETPKGTRHPFALYGWGEKQTDTGSQKTHNVCASASANECSCGRNSARNMAYSLSEGKSNLYKNSRQLAPSAPRQNKLEFSNDPKGWNTDDSIMIHESALRAKNRRQVEKRKLSQRRIHSAEVERTWRAKSSGPDNPWMTEYMRCYSARAR